jgi:hypothetical protein
VMRITKLEGFLFLLFFVVAVYGLLYELVWEHEMAHVAVWEDCGVMNASVKVSFWLAGSTTVFASENESVCARPYNNLNEIVSYNLGSVFQLVAVGFFFVLFCLVMWLRED